MRAPGGFSRIRVRSPRRKVQHAGHPDAAISSETVEVLLQNVYAERQARFDAIDGLDAKAGILFGFSGVLIALVGTIPHWWMRGLVLAPSLVSAGFCLAALLVRRVKITNSQKARDRYLKEPPSVAGRTLLDTLTGQEESIDSVLSEKADLVQVALVTLAVAIACMAVLVLITGGK